MLPLLLLGFSLGLNQTGQYSGILPDCPDDYSIQRLMRFAERRGPGNVANNDRFPMRLRFEGGLYGCPQSA